MPQRSPLSFDLPPERIATDPVLPRDRSRMLVVNNGIYHSHIRDLPDWLDENDVLVVNDSSVIPARLIGRYQGRPISLTLIDNNHTGDRTIWRALAKPARILRPHKTITFKTFSATIIGRHQEFVIIDLDLPPNEIATKLEDVGHMPLPPYIERRRREENPTKTQHPGDRSNYQTVFATNPGAVAAPTAGLHFTPRLLAGLRRRGVTIVPITLHVSLATFMPIGRHAMYGERVKVPSRTIRAINHAQSRNGRVVAVGTTVCRALEAATQSGHLRRLDGDTNLFIQPGYAFHIVDMLLTNFHLPSSSLLSLVSAFMGTQAIDEAYRQAIDHHYRFYSYGDCCLLHR